MHNNDAGTPPGGRYALILAGGSGTRLWPLSRTLLPKQLLALDGEKTLLQATFERVAGAFAPAGVTVVTNEEHVFEVRAQIRGLAPDAGAAVLAGAGWPPWAAA